MLHAMNKNQHEIQKYYLFFMRPLCDKNVEKGISTHIFWALQYTLLSHLNFSIYKYDGSCRYDRRLRFQQQLCDKIVLFCRIFVVKERRAL